MDSSIEKYLKTIKSLTYLNANWLPTTAIKLGDYGTLVDNVFNRIGNIKDDFQISIKTTSGTSGNLVYTSQNKVTALNNLDASISQPNTGQVSANYKMSFLTEDGFIFQALNSVQKEIKNIKQIGEMIVKKYQEIGWKSEYVVITKLIQAPKTTVMIFRDKDASVVLSANGATSETDVLKGNVGFSFEQESNMAFSFASQDNIKSLIGMHRISLGFLGDNNIQPIDANQFFGTSLKYMISNFLSSNSPATRRRSQMAYNLGKAKGRGIRSNADILKTDYIYKTTFNQNILKQSYRKEASLLSRSRKGVTQNLIIGAQSYKAISPSYNEIKKVAHKMNGKGYLIAATVFNENKKGNSSYSTGKKAYSVAVFETV